MEIIFHSRANETHFDKEGCAPGLILKVRVFRTRKWPIGWVTISNSCTTRQPFKESYCCVRWINTLPWVIQRKIWERKKVWINSLTLCFIKIQVPLYGESSGPGTIASQTWRLSEGMLTSMPWGLRDFSCFSSFCTLRQIEKKIEP